VGRRWRTLVAAWAGLVTLLCALVLAFEDALPLLVGPGGRFTPLLWVLNAVLLALFAVGAVLSVRRQRLTGDPLLGYVAFFQIALAFSAVAVVLGETRYDVWWYLNRIVLVGGGLVVLGGHVLEYVRLFRGEIERTRQLRESEERFATAFRANPGRWS
jgi:hypothetical protein